MTWPQAGWPAAQPFTAFRAAPPLDLIERGEETVRLHRPVPERERGRRPSASVDRPLEV